MNNDNNLKNPEENSSITTPNTDVKLGKTGLLINRILNPKVPEPDMKDFGHFHDDLVYDQKKITEIEDHIKNENYHRADDRLQKRGENNGDGRLDKIIAEMNSEEKLVSEALEDTTSEGIVHDKWINYNREGKESFKVIELATVNKADDYRNRIDAPFCFEFPKNSDGEVERIFVGFDATLSIDQDTINDKLTRSTNVSRERKQAKNLPFGFSTLRYAYDPSTGEHMTSDEVIRYTICADRKLFKTMQEVSNDISPLAEKAESPAYQEIRFKILSEMHEQNLLFKAMNPDNSKALEKINKLDDCIWDGIKKATNVMLKNIDETSPFFDLASDFDALKKLNRQFKSFPEDSPEYAAFRLEAKNKRQEIYEEISRRYRTGEAGASDISYAKMIYSARDFVKAATETNLLDKYKTSQPRNVSFNPTGNVVAMKEWYRKTDKDGKANQKSN